MADYLATNTARFRCTQTGPRGTHRMVFRMLDSTSNALALAAINPILQSMFPLMLNGTSWASVERAAEGSDVFLPVPFAPLNAPENTENANNAHEYGRYVNFVGRTFAGSRVAFYLFNVTNASLNANNRLTGVENAQVPTILAAIAANDDVLVGIDQNPFFMKAYANTGINDRVGKKSRSLV